MSMLFALLLFATPAFANGQTTHVWITRAALTRVPPGALKDLLVRPEFEPMVVHGTMFPDGGYPLGHPYGETAHWEPFQTRYLEWIKSEFELPYGDDAAPHIAFLMGLGSHGLADQTFDAFYLDRSQLYDGELGWAAGYSMDEATDLKWAILTGPQDVPDRWVPTEALVPLFADAGVEVDAETLANGQSLLELAINAIAASAAVGDPSFYEEQFPWAMDNLENTALPGIPDYEADVIVSYWDEIWDRLHDRSGDVLIDRTWPRNGGYGLSTDARSPDARISIIFRQGLLEDALTPEQLTVVDPNGIEQDVSLWLYYRDDSHILHLIPGADWPEDSWLTVTVSEGLTTRTGATLSEDYTFEVSTETAPAPDTASPDDDTSESDGTGTPKARCGCTATPLSIPGLLGVGVGLSGLILIRRRTAIPTDQP